jgi:pyruvate/2-oxoglutarate dehydrogenase complex dihydrolipoamide acyltransferase (E2) component
MGAAITIPMASIGQERAEIVVWLKQVGDIVTAGEPVLQIETDKAVVDVVAPIDGVLQAIAVRQGVVPVKAVVGWVGPAGETHREETSQAQEASAASPAPQAVPPERPRAEDGPARPASPAARRRAAELGVSLDTVTGTGPGGRITQADVERASSRGNR